MVALETGNIIFETVRWLKSAKMESGKHNGTSVMPKRRNGETGNGKFDYYYY